MDGNPISCEAAQQYIPNVLTNGEYVWEIAQDDWIVECYDIKNEDGKVSTFLRLRLRTESSKPTLLHAPVL